MVVHGVVKLAFSDTFFSDRWLPSLYKHDIHTQLMSMLFSDGGEQLDSVQTSFSLLMAACLLSKRFVSIPALQMSLFFFRLCVLTMKTSVVSPKNKGNQLKISF